MTKKQESHIFELFAGEYVSIILDMQVESVSQKSDTIDMVKHPLNVTGYLTDEDDDYFFLGHEPNIYNQAVKKAMIVHIEVIEEEEEKPETFKDSKAPNGGKFN